MVERILGKDEVISPILIRSSIMVRWSNAYDVGLRNRKMGVGIPRESPKLKKIIRKGEKNNDDNTRGND